MGLGDIQRTGEETIMECCEVLDRISTIVGVFKYFGRVSHCSQPINRPTDRSIYQSIFQSSNKVNVLLAS